MALQDIEKWLAEKDREAVRLQDETFWWARAAAWISLLGVMVSVAIAVLGR